MTHATENVLLKDAKQAMREALINLTSSNRPINKSTVPQEVVRILIVQGAGEVNQEEAWRAMDAARSAMIQSGEIQAPEQQWRDWRLLR